jgi:hypothetical protein
VAAACCCGVAIENDSISRRWWRQNYRSLHCVLAVKLRGLRSR